MAQAGLLFVTVGLFLGTQCGFYGLSSFLWRGAIDQLTVGHKSVDAWSPWELW